ncbi:MAG: hypothetical protein U0R68_11075 [Candidatus Nanopelagicales bacterium]
MQRAGGVQRRDRADERRGGDAGDDRDPPGPEPVDDRAAEGEHDDVGERLGERHDAGRGRRSRGGQDEPGDGDHRHARAGRRDDLGEQVGPERDARPVVDGARRLDDGVHDAALGTVGMTCSCTTTRWVPSGSGTSVVLGERVEQRVDLPVEGVRLLEGDDDAPVARVGGVGPLGPERLAQRGQRVGEAQQPLGVRAGHAAEVLVDQHRGLDVVADVVLEHRAAVRRPPPPLAPAGARGVVLDHEAVRRELAQVVARHPAGLAELGREGRGGAGAALAQPAEHLQPHEVGQPAQGPRVKVDPGAVGVAHDGDGTSQRTL